MFNESFKLSLPTAGEINSMFPDKPPWAQKRSL